MKKQKETGITVGFFSYFAWGIHLKARSMVGIEKPEWKLKAKLASNTIFEGN